MITAQSLRSWLTGSKGSFVASQYPFPVEFLETQGSFLWIATSGTTSLSPTPRRWIAHTRESLFSSAKSVCSWLEVSEADSWARILPMHHMGGLSIEARSVLSGCRVLYRTPPWDPVGVRDWLNEHRATIVSVVPTQVYDWVQKQVRAPVSLRAVIVGGDRLGSDLVARAGSLGWPILRSYGLTETASMIACDLNPSENESNGLPVLDHVSLKENQSGLLEIESEALFSEELVWDEVQKCFFKVLRTPGPWVSSDLGHVQDHRVRVLGRADDLVKVLGSLVHLGQCDLKLAACLSAAGYSQHAVVVSVPDDRQGHRLELRVEGPQDPELAKKILDLWNQKCAGIERAQRLVWLDQIPRTELGKIRRTLIR